jgi:hypothetical protein
MGLNKNMCETCGKNWLVQKYNYNKYTHVNLFIQENNLEPNMDLFYTLEDMTVGCAKLSYS